MYLLIVIKTLFYSVQEGVLDIFMSVGKTALKGLFTFKDSRDSSRDFFSVLRSKLGSIESLLRRIDFLLGADDGILELRLSRIE